jgi:hypothetical protein
LAWGYWDAFLFSKHPNGDRKSAPTLLASGTSGIGQSVHAGNP